MYDIVSRHIAERRRAILRSSHAKECKVITHGPHVFSVALIEPKVAVTSDALAAEAAHTVTAVLIMMSRYIPRDTHSKLGLVI